MIIIETWYLFGSMRYWASRSLVASLVSHIAWAPLSFSYYSISYIKCYLCLSLIIHSESKLNPVKKIKWSNPLPVSMTFLPFFFEKPILTCSSLLDSYFLLVSNICGENLRVRPCFSMLLSLFIYFFNTGNLSWIIS